MENKINIAEILKDCPKDTKLYSPLFGEVKLFGISENSVSILFIDGRDYHDSFSKNGNYYPKYSQSECLLFPSREMRDWTKFFKRGDVVWSKDNMYAIFESWANDDYTKFNTTIDFYEFDASFDKEVICDTALYVKVSDKGRAMFIANAEKHYKGKYNPDTLQVEPIKPTCPFKPFDKVIARFSKLAKWTVDLFSYYEKDCETPYVCIGGPKEQCIKYEGNEHLLGTTYPYTEGGSE